MSKFELWFYLYFYVRPFLFVVVGVVAYKVFTRITKRLRT